MNHNVPCLVLSRRLMKDIHQAADRMPRKHKYTYGSDVRSLTMKVWILCTRAWQDRAQRVQLLEQALSSLDEIKLQLQLGADLNAFSFGKFEELWRSAVDLGKQIGGWKASHHPKGQSPAAQSIAPAERASILSTGAALQGANR